MPSGEEIQRALTGFVGRWSDYSGTEKSEAQTFLNQLFACYGSDRREVGAEFEFFAPAAGFMDLHWPGVALIEMKAPVVELQVAQQQVERSWRASSNREEGRPAARWIVICNFRRFEIWEYGRYPDAPVAAFDLADLPDRYDALAFLAGPTVEPHFTVHHREPTKETARVVAEVRVAGRAVGRAADGAAAVHPAVGAHDTPKVDIMKIVTPTIIRPRRARLDAATTPAQTREWLEQLCRFKVLDPACGCGNSATDTSGAASG